MQLCHCRRHPKSYHLPRGVKAVNSENLKPESLSDKNLQARLNETEFPNLLLVLGKYIEFLRVSNNLSQEELSKKCGVHRTYISEVEHAKRNLSVGILYLIASGFGLTMDELLVKAMEHASEEEEKR